MQEITEQEYTYFDDLYDEVTARGNYRAWSPTSMNVFLSCRLRYFFQYVKRWRIKTRSLNLSLGNAFHAAAELANRKIALDREVSVEDLREENAKVWDKETSGMILGKDYKTQKEFDRTETISQHLIERFWNSHSRKAMEPMLYTPPYCSVTQMPAVELHVDVPFINVETGKAIRDDHHIAGYIDFVAQGSHVCLCYQVYFEE
jgi:hypothetical protein